MIVNIGSKENGYYRVSSTVRDVLENYLDNVAPRMNKGAVEENVDLARSILSGKSIAKYSRLIGTVLLASVSLLGLLSPELAFATTGAHIDISPLDKFFNEVYWTMFKVLMYLSTPVWAWIGFILALGGANNEKRTLAKRLAGSLIAGTGMAAGAPWASDALFSLWKTIF